MELEKRKEDRLVLSLPVQYKIFDVSRLAADVLDTQLAQKADLLNLSTNGLQVTSDKPFGIGAVLELEVELPGQGRVRSVAKVVWCKQDEGAVKNVFRSGIQLIPVYESDLEKLKAFFQKDP